MAVQNSIQKRPATKPTFGMTINSDGYKRMINSTLGDPQKAARFVTAITSAVVTNPALQECDASTIVSAGLLGESLNLSPSPQLGQYYIVPYKDKKNNRTTAQFQLGYRGMLQLAQRSGEYKRINAMAVKQGELLRYDPFNDEIELRYTEDESVRESLPTIGYFAMFEYHNGFRKVLYWSREKMMIHADRYSAAFSLYGSSGRYNKVSFEDYLAGKYDKKDEWLYSSFWYKDFDAMAVKTMLRQLLSKWGVMSLEMQKAYSADGGVISADGSVDYVDSPENFDQPDFADAAPQNAEPIPEDSAPADASAALFG